MVRIVAKRLDASESAQYPHLAKPLRDELPFTRGKALHEPLGR